MTTNEEKAPATPMTVVNWYSDRRNVAALIRATYERVDGLDFTAADAAQIVEKPWCWDSEWDAYQATLPEADRWCARGTR